MSPDPIGEMGGANLYGFVENNGIDRADKLGRNWCLYNGVWQSCGPHDPPPWTPPNTSDGLGFWEAVDQYYNGNGRDITIPFSAVDPGWNMEKLFTKEPCDLLGGYIFFGTNPRKWKHEEVIDMFNWKEMFKDNGKSGPGRIVIKADSSFSFKLESLIDGENDEYSWTYDATIYAPPNRFDFDPQKWGIRDWYKELITRGIHYSPGGADFWMYFSGNRQIQNSGKCCCNVKGPVRKCTKR